MQQFSIVANALDRDSMTRSVHRPPQRSREMFMKNLVLLLCIMLSANAFAECTTNGRGATVCGNGQTAGAYNRNTGTAVTSQTNQNGVRTTQTNRGGEAKTMNGKGVVHGPGGTSCYRTANSHGCN